MPRIASSDRNSHKVQVDIAPPMHTPFPTPELVIVYFDTRGLHDVLPLLLLQLRSRLEDLEGGSRYDI